jgi:hypothetical protein
VHPHFSGDGSQYFVAIFQFHSEHSVAQSFQNYSILFNQWLFRHTIFGAAKILVCSGNMKIKWKKILKMWKIIPKGLILVQICLKIFNDARFF